MSIRRFEIEKRSIKASLSFSLSEQYMRNLFYVARFSGE